MAIKPRRSVPVGARHRRDASVGAIRLADVSYPIARTAARISASTGISMPDAIVIGTALEHGAGVLATNDRGWPASLAAAADGLTIVQLGTFVRDAA